VLNTGHLQRSARNCKSSAIPAIRSFPTNPMFRWRKS
jgi:hypothetical protein